MYRHPTEEQAMNMRSLPRILAEEAGRYLVVILEVEVRSTQELEEFGHQEATTRKIEKPQIQTSVLDARRHLYLLTITKKDSYSY
jgi:hypothetical protein